jgi:hypothetical protein
MASNIIHAAADAVAQAAEDREDADAALAVAVATRNAVSGRISALETERSALLVARRGGDTDDATQGARLVLIDADVADLKVLLSNAEATVAPLQITAQNARQRVSGAEASLVTETENEVLKQLIVRADALADLLFDAATEIEDHKPRIATSRNLWTPQKKTADLIHRLALTGTV